MVQFGFGRNYITLQTIDGSNQYLVPLSLSSFPLLPLVVCSPLRFFKRLTRVIKDTEKVHFVIMSGKLIMEGCRLMTHFPGLITCVLANYIG